MAKKKGKLRRTEPAAEKPTVTPALPLTPVSTRNRERPAHSIRIVRGRKDEKS